jgi:hypothetical protein
MKKQAYFLFLFSVLFLLVGCTAKNQATEPVPTTQAVVTKNDTATSDNSQGIAKTPESNVIFDFILNVNNCNYDNALNALNDLTDKTIPQNIKMDFSKDNNAVLKNIKHITIKTLIDKTGKGELWNKDERLVGNMYDWRIYYAEFDYELNHTALSDLVDGVNYHQIVIVKSSKEEPWKIARIAGADSKWKDK